MIKINTRLKSQKTGFCQGTSIFFPATSLNIGSNSTTKIKEKFPGHKTEITGEFRRQLAIIESLEWVTTVSSGDLKNYLLNDQITLVTERDGMLVLTAEETLVLRFYTVAETDFYEKLFQQWLYFLLPKQDSS